MVKDETEHTPLKDINVFNPSKTIIDRYLYTVGGLIGKKVLDVGCGCGHGCALMKVYGANSVVGMDNNKIALKEANSNYNNLMDVDFVDNLDNFEDDTFDFVTSFEVIEHIESKELDELIIKLKKLCKNGSMMIFSTPITKTSKSTDPNHINNFTIETLETFLEKHFKNSYVLYSTVEIKKGITTNLILENGVHNLACSFIIFIINNKGDKNGKDKHNINE